MSPDKSPIMTYAEAVARDIQEKERVAKAARHETLMQAQAELATKYADEPWNGGVEMGWGAKLNPKQIPGVSTELPKLSETPRGGTEK